MYLQQPFTAKLAGTGAALNVSTGFSPKLVLLFNETQLSIAANVKGMAAARALAIVDSGVGTTDVLLKTSNGITLNSQGFTIGTDSALNSASDVIYAVAF